MALTSRAKILGIRCNQYLRRMLPQDAPVKRLADVLGQSRQTAARLFAERNTTWILHQLQHQRDQPTQARPWQPGTEILFRGQLTPLVVTPHGAGAVVQLAGETWPAPAETDLRPTVERQLRALAARELPARTLALAEIHGFAVQRVTVRNQCSRWGSCSRRGTLSLNWRLIQMPDFVRDYVIWHELAHTREHNHSARFWRLVEQVCPEYPAAQRWLKHHRSQLASVP